MSDINVVVLQGNISFLNLKAKGEGREEEETYRSGQDNLHTTVHS
jgi:hypothetical protein